MAFVPLCSRTPRVSGALGFAQVLNDLHLLDTRSRAMAWSGPVKLRMSPAARVGHTLAMWGAEMYVFGGGDATAVSSRRRDLATEAEASACVFPLRILPPPLLFDRC